MPGTCIAGEPLVTIAAFAPQLHVITSKQRPRKLTIHGSDGAEYMFLLKGHEDLRQDERVMQLFGLVNNMLATDRVTAERDLSIARYAVIPLSPNSGLIGCGLGVRRVGLAVGPACTALQGSSQAAPELPHPACAPTPSPAHLPQLGAQHRHAARPDPRVSRRTQDTAQRGAPPHAGCDMAAWWWWGRGLRRR